MKKLILPVSLVLNVVLIAAAIFFVAQTRRNVRTVIVSVRGEQLGFQQHCLEQLKLNDPEITERLKATLENHISQGNRRMAHYPSLADNR